MSANPAESDDDRAGEALHQEYLHGVRDFSNRTIANVRLVNADLSGCNFTGARFMHSVLGAVTFNDGVFDGARFDLCDVSDSQFQRASLKQAELGPAIFNGANFFMASLRGANFFRCDATGAVFGLTDLRDANLYGGTFSKALFLMTNLNGATLVGGNFEGTVVKYFNSINAETLRKNAALLAQTLGQPKELEAIVRQRREVEALNELPEFLNLLDRTFEYLRRFLLASGCQPDEVARMGDAADKGRGEYPRVFVSYSTEDEDLATRLYRVLTEFGVDVWFAPEKMQGGRKIHEQLEAAIADRDKIILILSNASMKSRWVASELQWAVAREIGSGEQILFPIRIVPFEAVRQWTWVDADVGEDVAKYVRQYFVPDFSAWRDDETLARLTERFLKDLRLSQAR